MSRYFEKISFEQFRRDISENKNLYLDYRMPNRKTMYAAGYDFYAIEGFEIKPGEIKKIPQELKLIWKVMRYYFWLIGVVWVLSIM